MIGILDFGPRLRSLGLFLSKYRLSLAFTLTVLLSQTPKKKNSLQLFDFSRLLTKERDCRQWVYLYVFV